jgi:hypothetical protein
MNGLTTSCALMELEQMQGLNKVLHDENTEYCSNNYRVFDSDYTQLVSPGTHVISEWE